MCVCVFFLFKNFNLNFSISIFSMKVKATMSGQRYSFFFIDKQTTSYESILKMSHEIHHEKEQANMFIITV